MLVTGVRFGTEQADTIASIGGETTGSLQFGTRSATSRVPDTHLTLPQRRESPRCLSHCCPVNFDHASQESLKLSDQYQIRGALTRDFDGPSRQTLSSSPRRWGPKQAAKSAQFADVRLGSRLRGNDGVGSAAAVTTATSRLAGQQCACYRGPFLNEAQRLWDDGYRRPRSAPGQARAGMTPLFVVVAHVRKPTSA